MSMGSSEEGKKKHVFTWRVKNFSMCSENKGQSLSSPTFKATSLDETVWCLKLFPRGRCDSEFISCRLCRVQDEGPTEIKCECLVEIIDEIGKTLKSQSYNYTCNKGFMDMCISVQRNVFTNTTLHKDMLIIRCQLTADVPEKALCSQNSCTTTIKTKKYSLQWDVTNLNSFPHQEVYKFFSTESTQIEITVKIPEDDIKIYIGLKTHLPSNFVMCHCVLLDNEGKERVSHKATHLFKSAEKWEFPSFIKKSQLNAESETYLKNDCFALKCDFTVSDGITSQEDDEKLKKDPPTGKLSISDEDTISMLNEDIKRLHSDKILSDVKLKVDEQLFSAHKCILSARSPVFFAMFSQDMAESQKGEVDIPDLDAKTVELFLEYIYTGL